MTKKAVRKGPPRPVVAPVRGDYPAADPGGAAARRMMGQAADKRAGWREMELRAVRAGRAAGMGWESMAAVLGYCKGEALRVRYGAWI